MGSDDFLIAFQSTKLGVSSGLILEVSSLLTLLPSCRIPRSPVFGAVPSATEIIGKGVRGGGVFEMTVE